MSDSSAITASRSAAILRERLPSTCAIAASCIARDCESIRSPTPSACSTSSFPFATARRVNSPGSASRAPAESRAPSARAGTSSPPCTLSSTISSPVYDFGAAYTIATGRSITFPLSGSLSVTRRATRGSSGHGRITRAATACASGPLSRITASAERPAGVARAAMVSPERGRERDEGEEWSLIARLPATFPPRSSRRARGFARPRDDGAARGSPRARGWPGTGPMSDAETCPSDTG